MTPSQHSLAAETAAPAFNAQDVINLTARLAQVLAEEVDLLGSMKVSKIAALQQEKIFLTNALEANRRMLMKYPHMRETIPSRDKGELEGVIEVFNDILEENHRRLSQARAANRAVVNAITQAVQETTKSAVYGRSGGCDSNGHALSVTLNQSI